MTQPSEVWQHSRRAVLKGAGLAGMAGLAGCIGGVDDDGDGEVDFDTVQFGVLEPFTGDFASLAEERNRG
ncbi:MAG: branched-chain amino acid ABC transporter substrate-binding protein, partial [Halobacteriota archaeon]